METSYFIVFDRNSHGCGPTVVAVRTSRIAAEATQLQEQQKCAGRCNVARAKAFDEGRGFSEYKTASDFVHEYYIQEVTNP